MQTLRGRSVMASLVLTAVMVLGVLTTAVVAIPSTHAAAATHALKTTETAQPNAVAMTKALHPPTVGKVQATVHSSTSSNWAGYANTEATGGNIYEVTAEWDIPTVTCSETSGTAWQAEWIGIDGFGNGNVSQTGSLAYCSGTAPHPRTGRGTEFYPYESIQYIAASSAGAFISAYVLYNPGECVNGQCGVYTLELYDVDNGVNNVISGGAWVCNAGVCEGGPDATAECISEAPASGSSILTLAKYSTTTFYGCADTIGSHFGGIGSHGSPVSTYKINQKQTHLDQSTGALSNYVYTKDKFTITWKGYH